jgi:hypothetical protein
MGNQTSQVVQSLQSEQRRVAIEQRFIASLPRNIDFESKHTFQICSHNKIIQLSSDIIATVATTSITVWNIYYDKLLSKIELDENPSYVYKYDDDNIGYVVQDEDFYTIDWRTKEKRRIAILCGREYSIHPFGCFVVAGSGNIELICTKSKDNYIIQLTTSRRAKNCVITGNALCIAGSSAHLPPKINEAKESTIRGGHFH